MSTLNNKTMKRDNKTKFKEKLPEIIYKYEPGWVGSKESLESPLSSQFLDEYHQSLKQLRANETGNFTVYPETPSGNQSQTWSTPIATTTRQSETTNSPPTANTSPTTTMQPLYPKLNNQTYNESIPEKPELDNITFPVGNVSTTPEAPITPITFSTTKSPNMCMCRPGFRLAKNGKDCSLPASKLNDFTCERDIDCEMITTIEGYKYQEKMEPHCKNGKCVCGDEKGWAVGSLTNQSKAACFKFAQRIGNGKFKCQYTPECSFLNNHKTETTASCGPDNICICDSEEWELHDRKEEPRKCQRPLQAQCEKNDHCKRIENARCYKNKCQCKRRYKQLWPFVCGRSNSKLKSSTFLMSFLVLLTTLWTMKLAG